MKDKKKLIIASSIILGSLVLILGVTYAAFTFNETGLTSKLIAGDIYMHYNETNGLVLSDAMPLDVIVYKVNEIMESQEVEDVNELTACTNFFGMGILDEGSDSTNFCKGKGTIDNGMTFQEALDVEMRAGPFGVEDIDYLEENNIIIAENDGKYIVNDIMKSQVVEYANELTACVNILGFFENEFDEGSDIESYCQGIGTAWGGITFENELDEWISWAKSESTIEEGFINNGGQELLDAGVIIQKIENLPYFEFTISGKNTYTKEDIWYEIVLNHGDNHDTRTTRIRDDLLRFSLVEIKDGKETTVINNQSFDNLANKRIWVNTIDKNTNEEIEITYRLYMWIDESTIIGNNNQDYTLEEWNDVFASIKVNVSGDFNEKQLAYEDKYNVTDERCFTAEIIDDTSVAIIDYDVNCGGTNVVIPKTINGKTVTEISRSDYYVGAFYEKGLTGVVIPNTIISIADGAFMSNSLTTLRFEENSTLTTIGMGAFDNNKLVNVVIPDSVISIKAQVFIHNYLETVVIGENVSEIGYLAFLTDGSYSGYNKITKVINKSGNSFNWNDIFGQESTDGNDEFATGIYKFYYNGDREVLITAE